MQRPMLARAALLLVLAVPQVARATDGYFSLGYGMKEIGRGGAGTAVSDDAMGGANNPATMAFAGARFDVGMTLFMPDRSASRTGNAYGLNGDVTSGNNNFAIPEFGINQPLSDQFTIGLTMYGNGGMNTDYMGGQIPAGHCGPGALAANLLCGVGKLGVDLQQLVIAPTVTYRPRPDFAIGISPLLAYQTFSAEGLQAFSFLSSAPASVTNNGSDSSTGGGVRIGMMWQATQQLAFGATYQSPIWMGKFSSYAGLFAQQGGFDIPQNFSVGLAWRPTPDLLIAADYGMILYGTVPAIANPSTNMAPLGSAGGPGFGWQNVNVFRLGVDYRVTPPLTLRAGFNYGNNPIRSSDVTFNMLAPGVVTTHLAMGATYDIGKQAQITFAYVHGFNNTVTGATSPLLPGGGTDKIALSENQIGLAFDWRW